MKKILISEVEIKQKLLEQSKICEMSNIENRKMKSNYPKTSFRKNGYLCLVKKSYCKVLHIKLSILNKLQFV